VDCEWAAWWFGDGVVVLVERREKGEGRRERNCIDRQICRHSKGSLSNWVGSYQVGARCCVSASHG
jgi:hypothetical protein